MNDITSECAHKYYEHNKNTEEEKIVEEGKLRKLFDGWPTKSYLKSPHCHLMNNTIHHAHSDSKVNNFQWQHVHKAA